MACSGSVHPRARSWNISEAENVLLVVRNKASHVPTYTDTSIIHRIESPRPSPSVFAILKTITGHLGKYHYHTFEFQGHD